MKKLLFSITVILLLILHVDFWNWRSARPLVFGFIPVSLFYHACYTLAISVLMWVMVRTVWPDEIEESVEDREIQSEETHR